VAGASLPPGFPPKAACRDRVLRIGRLRGLALDVGTGKGPLARELARQGVEVVSIDISDEERELAHHHELIVMQKGS